MVGRLRAVASAQGQGGARWQYHSQYAPNRPASGQASPWENNAVPTFGSLLSHDPKLGQRPLPLSRLARDVPKRRPTEALPQKIDEDPHLGRG